MVKGMLTMRTSTLEGDLLLYDTCIGYRCRDIEWRVEDMGVTLRVPFLPMDPLLQNKKMSLKEC
jgi:hypothetical protein